MTNLGFEEGVKKLGYKFKRADVGDKYVSQDAPKRRLDAWRRAFWSYHMP